MNSLHYEVSQIDFMGHADLVLSDTNIFVDKRLKETNTECALKRAISYHVLHVVDAKLVRIREVRVAETSATIEVEVANCGQ